MSPGHRSMRVYLLRHATAAPHGSGPDAARPLVEKGWKQVRRVVDFCRVREILPEVVLTSPLVRARETATGFCQGLGLPAPEVVPWLAIGRAAAETPAELDAWRDHASVCLVGHEPDFSQLAAWFLGTSPGRLDVSKASLLALDMTRPSTPGRANLVFFLPNRLMAGGSGPH